MVFVDGLFAYLSAYVAALVDLAIAPLPRSVPCGARAPRRAAPASAYVRANLRRLRLLVLFPLFMLLQAVHAACLILDHLLFPGFRRVELRRPVFVLGVPRSGTTFLHRELARDDRFCAPRTWEVLFAPSLCQRHIVRAVLYLDLLIGRPVARLVNRVAAHNLEAMDDVHPVALDAPEEDYLALLPSGGCFFAYLAFPRSPAFDALSRLDRLPPRRRERLLEHYHGLLQRQLYFHGAEQILSKNAAFAGWGRFLAERYPDAHFVLCIREPAAALASQLNSLAGARAAFASFPDDLAFEAAFEEHYATWWQELARMHRDSGVEPLVVEQEWLRGHTSQVLAQIYDRLREAKREATSAGDSTATPTADAPAEAAYAELRAASIRQRGRDA